MLKNINATRSKIGRIITQKIYDVLHDSPHHKTNRILSPYNVANSIINDGLSSNNPFFVGRLGAVECRICWRFARASFYNNSHNQKSLEGASIYAGISSINDPNLNIFSTIYISAIPYIDLIGFWEVRGMAPLLRRYGQPNLQYTQLDFIEPWRSLQDGIEPWTMSLANKRVLVIHPFTETIRSQYERRKTIAGVSDILPDFELKIVQPPVTFAGENNGLSWLENFQILQKNVANTEFDIALIGCGSYGLPIAAFIKQMGKKAIHLGGSTQLLFGIRGKRWDDDSRIAKFYDKNWVRPSSAETPKKAQRVESGCYW